jgi:hypothetical protein
VIRLATVARAMLVAGVLSIAAGASAQTGGAPETNTAAETRLPLQALRDLPSSNNLFSVFETVDANVISDRFYGGGLNFGRPARVGGFLNSWTQTQYRVGGVNITAPDGSGSPFLFPTLGVWERVTIATDSMPLGFGAPGLGVTLEPVQPTGSWTGVADYSGAGSGFVSSPSSSAPAPPIQTLTGWSHASVLASGPVVANRLGIAAALDWTQSSQIERTGAAEPDGRATSLFAHAVYAASQNDSIRAIGWYQRTQAPFMPTLTSAPTTATTEQTFTHIQSSWERVAPGLAWQLFGGYSQRDNTRSNSSLPGTLTMERLTDGPVPLLADSGDRTDRRWSVGLHAAPTSPPPGGVTNAVQFGANVSGASSRVGAFAGSIGELVDGARARMWTYTSSGIDAHRHETTVSAFVADTIQGGRRVTADIGLAYDGVSGSADGSAQGVTWHTLLPSASLWLGFSDNPRTRVFVAYRRAADALPLDTLAFGDPAAPTGTVSAWGSQGIGAIVARVGPGTGGNPAFSAIDPALKRPITDELTVGAEYRPNASIRVRLSGIIKNQRDIVQLVNTGVPISSYTLSNIVDGRPEGDVQLPVYNRNPSSFGRDQYLLTNPSDDSATFSGAVLSGDVTQGSWTFLFGATASQTDAVAASRGFHAEENDPEVIGEAYADPNAATSARGRLFFDRAFTIKLASIHRFSHGFTLGLVARYQDGQPFSRVTVVPGLNQGTDFVRAYPNGDARFTFTGTLDARLQKGFAAGPARIDAMFDVYNLFNLGYEVEEQIVTGPGFRTITAIQPPRALHLGVRVSF